MKWNPIDYFFDYTIGEIPRSFIRYWWLGGAWLLTIFVYFLFEHKYDKKYRMYRCLLLETIIFILCCTLIMRQKDELNSYNLVPFWSYRIDGSRGLNLILENILNILLYIPVGIFLAGSMKSPYLWKAVLFGCILSLLTESCQLIFKCGFCETDDVIHNTLGCLIGFCIFVLIEKCFERIKNRYVIRNSSFFER